MESTAVEVMDLTVGEKTELAELETIIESGMKSFLVVGRALLKIRDSRLYRDSHRTFDDYCRDRWGMSRVRAHQLIEATKVSDNLLTTVNKPTSEWQARPLARLEPEQQAEAWQEAVETAPEGKITAMHVENIVRKREMGGDEQTTRASEAMQYVTIAISQMDRIRADDPRRGEAIDKMQRWINKNKKGGR